MNEQVKFRIKMLTASLFFFDFMLWCVGLIFIMIGTYSEQVLTKFVMTALNNKEAREAKEHLLEYIPPAALFFGISVLMASLGSCTFIFSKTHFSKFLFALIIGIIFILQVVLSVLCLWYQSAVDRSTYSRFNSSLFGFDTGSEDDIQVNVAQSRFECCGLIYYTDWFHTHWARGRMTVPPSCCRDIYKCHNLPPLMINHIYTRGCQEALQQSTETSNQVAIAGLSIILVAQVVGFSVAIALGITMKKAQADDMLQQKLQPISLSPAY